MAINTTLYYIILLTCFHLTAFRLNYISTSSHVHLSKLEFWESKYSMLAFLTLAESKLKSWIIKYGRLESMELLLQSYGVSIQARVMARDCLTEVT